VSVLTDSADGTGLLAAVVSAGSCAMARLTAIEAKVVIKNFCFIVL
jgi:hypothetical protein